MRAVGVRRGGEDKHLTPTETRRNPMADELEELNVEPEGEASNPTPRAPAPPEVTGPLPTPTPSGKAFPQLYRFFWGGLLVFVGGMLPFGPDLVTKVVAPKDEQVATKRLANQADAAARKALAEGLGKDQPVSMDEDDGEVAMLLPARPANNTFVGALFMVFGLMLMGQMYNCIRERKIALGGVLLMLFPCAWTWLKLCTIGAEIEGFSWGNLWRLDAWEFLSTHMGSGFLLILGGSTYVVFNFLMAIFGAASGGKKDDAPAASSPKRGAGARRR